MREFGMPAMGADMESGTLLEWKVAPGDEVHVGDIIAVVDTDKSAIDVEVFHDGIVDSLLVDPGTEVPVGAAMALLREPGETTGPEPLPAGAAPSPTGPEPAPAERARPAPSIPTARRQMAPVSHGTAVSSPLVRRLAESSGIDLADRTGTGPGGSITRGDVDRWTAGRPDHRRRVTPRARRLARERGVDLERLRATGTITATDIPDVDAERTESERKVSIRRAIAAVMARSAHDIPHYHLAETVDLGPALAQLQELNVGRAVPERVIPGALLLHAAARATAEVPALNGTYQHDMFVPRQTVDLGVAISLRGGGLVAPAITDAAGLTLDQMMAALRDLILRSRTGRLRSSDLSGGSITVTSLGDQGVQRVHGVIYPPQVALIGFGRIAERPWVADGELCVRPTVEVTLAGDHRVSDGLEGSRLLRAVARHLTSPPPVPAVSFE